MSWEPFAHDYDIVCFHSPCNDGHTSAALIWSGLPQKYRDALSTHGGLYSRTPHGVIDPYPTSAGGAHALQLLGYPVVFVATSPDEQLPIDFIRGKRVLMLDRWISRNSSEIAAFLGAVHSAMVIDHHSGNEASVKLAVDLDKVMNPTGPRLNYVFSPQREYSGASLTWYHIANGAFPPELIRCVQIADTWNWQQEPTLPVRQIITAMRTRRSFDTLPAIALQLALWTDEVRGELTKQGRLLEDHIAQEVDQIAGAAAVSTIIIADVRYGVLHVATPVHISEVGARMRDLHAPDTAGYRLKDGTNIAFTATWRYNAADKAVYVSLRSPAPGIDLAVIAANVPPPAIPGGGHRAAAGFSIPDLASFSRVFLDAL